MEQRFKTIYTLLMIIFIIRFLLLNIFLIFIIQYIIIFSLLGNCQGVRRNRKNRLKYFSNCIHNINTYIFSTVYDYYFNVIKTIVHKIFHMVKLQAYHFYFMPFIYNIQSLIDVIFRRQTQPYYNQYYFTLFSFFFQLRNLIFDYISIINDSFFFFKKIFDFQFIIKQLFGQNFEIKNLRLSSKILFPVQPNTLLYYTIFL